jgi:hypothetical protein
MNEKEIACAVFDQATNPSNGLIVLVSTSPRDLLERIWPAVRDQFVADKRFVVTPKAICMSECGALRVLPMVADPSAPEKFAGHCTNGRPGLVIVDETFGTVDWRILEVLRAGFHNPEDKILVTVCGALTR